MKVCDYFTVKNSFGRSGLFIKGGLKPRYLLSAGQCKSIKSVENKSVLLSLNIEIRAVGRSENPFEGEGFASIPAKIRVKAISRLPPIFQCP